MSNNSGQSRAGQDAPPPSGLPKVIAYIFTAFIFFGTIALLVWAFIADIKDPLWARIMTLFNVLASLGYAGVGYLFGHQVQVVNLSEARKDAAQAKQKVTEMKQEAADALQTNSAGHDLAAKQVLSADDDLVRVQRHLRNILAK